MTSTSSRATMATITDEADPLVRWIDDLDGRCEQLRRTAQHLPEPAARAMRRRAAEVEMQSWLLAATAGLADLPDPCQNAA